VVGEPGEDALQRPMVGPVEGQAAAPLVRDREDAVDVGKSRRQASPRNRSAMYFEVLAEQLTVLMTAT